MTAKIHKLPVSPKGGTDVVIHKTSSGGIDVDATAKAASKQLETLTDVRDIDRFAGNVNKLKKIVGELTGKPAEINKLARPWLKAIVKCGRTLKKMSEDGERRTRGDTSLQRQSSRLLHNVTTEASELPPTLKELGFARPRAARWQLAGELPDDLRDEFFSKTENRNEGILTLHPRKSNGASVLSLARR
jgi:hypothetical protein